PRSAGRTRGALRVGRGFDAAQLSQEAGRQPVGAARRQRRELTMDAGWVIELAMTEAALTAAGSLRLSPGVMVRCDGVTMWIAGPASMESPPWDRLLPPLPARGRYRVTDEDELSPVGRRVPTRAMPKDNWR